MRIIKVLSVSSSWHDFYTWLFVAKEGEQPMWPDNVQNASSGFTTMDASKVLPNATIRIDTTLSRRTTLSQTRISFETSNSAITTSPTLLGQGTAATVNATSTSTTHTAERNETLLRSVTLAPEQDGKSYEGSSQHVNEH